MKRLTLKGEPTENLKQLEAEYQAILDKPSARQESEVDGVFSFAGRLSELAQKVSQIRNEVRRINRHEAAKRTYRIKKSLGLIKTAAQKKAAKEARRKEEIEEQRWRDSYVPESCYCWQGNPPCGWCLDPKNDPDYVEVTEEL